MTNQLLIVVTCLVTLTTLLVLTKCIKKQTVFTAVLAIVFGTAYQSYASELSTIGNDVYTSIVKKSDVIKQSHSLNIPIKGVENTVSVTYQTLIAFSTYGLTTQYINMYKHQTTSSCFNNNLGQTKYYSYWLNPRIPPPQINSS